MGNRGLIAMHGAHLNDKEIGWRGGQLRLENGVCLSLDGSEIPRAAGRWNGLISRDGQPFGPERAGRSSLARIQRSTSSAASAQRKASWPVGQWQKRY